MKIIFLDIDGVLNSTRSVLARDSLRGKTQLLSGETNLPYGVRYSLETVDPVAVGLLNRLSAKDPDLRFVLSSTHRTFFSKNNDGIDIFGEPEHLDALRVYLCALGLDLGPHCARLLDITPKLFTKRGQEVAQWLEVWSRTSEAQISHHLALDDGSDFEPFYSNLIRVDPSQGFSAEQFYLVAQALDINESAIIF